MIIFRDVAYENCDTSSIKIKVKLSVEPYSIEYYKNYILNSNIIGKTKQKNISVALDSMKDFLSKEYDVYLPDSKEQFEKEMNSNINKLAKCLLE